ncbi:MAG: ADP-polyphosphate phosphotransferase [Burkholderiales bacterium]
MKIRTSDFRVGEGVKVKLDKRPTRVKPYYESKEDYETLLAGHVAKLREKQPILYAHNRHALLIIFQAMDAAGKDGAIKHVMSGVNPQGCQVVSFKHPSAEVLAHDFLWNASRFLPERGRIGIFNRSYYEEVLIVRVLPHVLAAELLPEESVKNGSIWRDRYHSIRSFERHLHRNGTRIVKFFLHLSKEEQRQRLLARLDDPERNWKFDEGDVEQRKHWASYMKAYETCLSETSTEEAPWYVVPADDKKNARLIVSRAIIEALDSIPMSYPTIDKARRKELERVRAVLEAHGESAKP